MFAYQSDGLFIVILIAYGPQLMFFDDQIVANVEVEGIDALAYMQQLFAQKDAAAAAMAAAANMPHPAAEVFDIVEDAEVMVDGDEPQTAEEGDGQPLIEVDAHNLPPVEEIEVAAELHIPILDTHVAEVAAATHAVLPEGPVEVNNGEGNAAAVEAVEQPHVELVDPAPPAEELPGADDDMPPPVVETEVGQGSAPAPDLDLKLGATSWKRVTYSKTVGPMFIKKIERTPLSLALSIPKSFWETYIRKPPGAYEFTFQMGRNSWDVVIKVNKSRVRVTNGFSAFVKANDIGVGTILKFELVKARRTVFIVSVQT